MKKERFISCYNAAREEGFSQRVIRAGWRATGLVPFNPDQVLSSSQISTRPATPPAPQRQQSASPELFLTPRKHSDFYEAYQRLLKSESLSRNARALIGKCGRSILRSDAREAHLEMRLQNAETRLDEFENASSKKRKRIDPNQRFHDAESIKAAIDQAADETAQFSTKKTRNDPKTISDIVAATGLDSMCTQFQT